MGMKVQTITEQNWSAAQDAALAVLRQGGLIIFPTETTYGLGADATNPQAIQKLLSYKTKRGDKPLSIAVSDEEMADAYVARNEVARAAYKRFLPGPVTVVSQGKQVVAPGVESQTGSLGVRIPDYPFLLELIERFGKPITATSANASGEKRPYQLQDIWDNISARQESLIDLALDAGTLPPNEPSTVIDTTQETLQIIRSGDISLGEAEHFTTFSPEETQALAKKISRRFASFYGYKSVLFSLVGEMGAGKTHFTKGLASGLGISETITSPTYTLAHEFWFKNEGKEIPFLHIDAWRMSGQDELAELGLQKYLEQKAVLSIEWPKSGLQLEQLGESVIVWIEMAYGASERERRISVRESR